MAITHPEAQDSSVLVSATSAERRAQLRRVALWTQIGAAALALLFVLLFAGVQYHERGQMRHGVHAFGVDLSGMTRAQARAALMQAAQQRAGRTLLLQDNGNQWTLDGAALGLTLDVDGAVQDAWAVGRHGWGPARVAALWHVRSDGREVGDSRVGVDGAALDAQLASLASAINQPRVDPSLTLTAGAPDASDDIATLVHYVHAQVGRAFDADATRASLLAALAGGQASVKLTVAENQPAATDADYAAARATLRNILDAPVELVAADQTWTLHPVDVASHLSVDPASKGKPSVVNVDTDWVAEVVDEIRIDTDTYPRSPRLWWDDNGQLIKTQDGANGQTLDADKGGAMIMGVFLGQTSDNRVVLPVSIQQAPPLPADLGTLGLNDEIAEASTPYGGSIPQRMHNIELAAQLINGTVVMPGQTFSFNAEVGPMTIDAGFQVAYGIDAENGELTTVPAEAGGICQVATTVFQPVFWSGYQIDQRTTHSYWIETYVSNGYVGLDATVDEPSGLDLKWTNTSSTAVMIEASADGQNFTVRLIGTAPNWRVEVDPPIITNVKTAPQEPVYEASDTIPDGSLLRIEHASDGFDAKIVRRVYVGDEVKTYEYDEEYGVAKNVTLVGSSTNELPADFVPPE
jgi:vancomycin resistance protein YoaR